MSYISSLNLLGDDSPVPLSEEALSEELAIWANAQFTFDTKPGQAVADDSYKAVAQQHDLFATFASLNELQPQSNNLMNNCLNSNNYLLPSTSSPVKTFQPTQPQPQSQQLHSQLLPRIAPAPPQQQQQQTQSPIQQIHNTSSAPSKKRKASIAVKESNDEELPDAIEEDKRKRNTAASARFRMKKKLREQALEQTAKEMTIKAEALEKRVIELEKEAKWLRALVVEKDPALLNAD
ncbi:regulatory protein cys-3 protein [Mucor ambiguus]|uniref:Regulatory protein cys-3 protein n=1 Tax=Mucor ambiguus TaxID=91626 RepID=A0A0C9LPH2_9FUNG|nr:regulatory protein cys-3 protein [Mucor ambiguus]